MQKPFLFAASSRRSKRRRALTAARVPRAAKYVWHLQGGWGQAGQGVIDAADTFFATNGSSIGPDTASSWFKEVPWAFRKQLKWVSDRCGAHELPGHCSTMQSCRHASLPP